MKELIGLTVKLFYNGDITVIDNPDGCKENFGPEYGSQRITKGTIIDAKPVVTYSREWLENGANSEPKYEVWIRITVQFNHLRKGPNYTTYWDRTPEQINYLLNQ